ncbi:hypothetical protein EC973_006728 [Apophysomyces ossiformis]|uniref:protein-tyrosine-phosphatase n=1 Tax=Apophysomyces ossiformis TaxID=679940 RepID=A0A8H7ERH8_9FUNG|nr:hypothetical protein EC973_006728 [Apophysomyces ossiformis]
MYLENRFTLHPPTYIEYKDQRFLILDAPAQTNLHLYIQEFERWNVTDVVRCCEATYSQHMLLDRGIRVHDWLFADDEPPSRHIVNQWLNLVTERFVLRERDEKQLAVSNQLPCIATHCVAGLGRAPVLVAIALIEKGMEPLDSIAYIRDRRQGAINNKQVQYIKSYKPRNLQLLGPDVAVDHKEVGQIPVVETESVCVAAETLYVTALLAICVTLLVGKPELVAVGVRTVDAVACFTAVGTVEAANCFVAVMNSFGSPFGQ